MLQHNVSMRTNTLVFVAFSFFTAACGEVSPVAGTVTPTPTPTGSASSQPDAGPPPATCTAGTSGETVVVVPANFGATAITVPYDCSALMAVTDKAAVYVCPYEGCAPDTPARVPNPVDGGVGAGIVATQEGLYLARAADGAVLRAEAPQYDRWVEVFRRPKLLPSLARIRERAVVDVTAGEGRVETWLLYTDEANARRLGEDLGGPSHLARYFSPRLQPGDTVAGFGYGRVLVNDVPALLSLASTPSLGYSSIPDTARLVAGYGLITTAGRVVSVQESGSGFGFASCPQSDLSCLEPISAVAPQIPDLEPPFFSAHGRLYAFKRVPDGHQAFYFEDADLVAGNRGTPLGKPLPGGGPITAVASDANHIYARTSSLNGPGFGVYRIAR